MLRSREVGRPRIGLVRHSAQVARVSLGILTSLSLLSACSSNPSPSDLQSSLNSSQSVQPAPEVFAQDEIASISEALNSTEAYVLTEEDLALLKSEGVLAGDGEAPGLSALVKK